MPEKIHLQVVTSTETTFSVTIKDIYIPAFNGEAGVLENHKPYISLLKPGEIVYTDIYDKKHYLYVHEGFIEVLDNTISIVSDALETGESLNKEEVETKLTELDQRVKSSLKGEITPEELVVALAQQREYRDKQTILQKMAPRKSNAPAPQAAH